MPNVSAADEKMQFAASKSDMYRKIELIFEKFRIRN